RLAETHGLFLLRDVTMPSNNRILIWQRAPNILEVP
ncbi:MAG: DUF938 domain-containing protein, partial [Candidatus Nitrotoga sp.]|nr:DUF938 domain-containing protein [Candidatus Nitrotoga sp.]